MSTNNLSVVIIAWNEEKDLPLAIASVKGMTDDIVVVVDEASIDKTKEVAKKLGCRVFDHEHMGIVEPMREFAIAKAKNDWILLLDADEEVSKELASEIKEILSDSKTDYCRIPRKNIIFGKWIKSAHWWPDYVVRLFKKESVKWGNNIHSQPIVSGKGIELVNPIIHINYSSISEYLEHINRYTQHQAIDTEFSWVDLIRKPSGEFLSQYFAREGYKDGLHGFALAGLQAFSEFILYLKLWEKTGFPQLEIKKEEVNKEITDMSKQYKWWSDKSWLNRFKNKLGL